jgi:O-succinylbenzoic acid--CoA ligase
MSAKWSVSSCVDFIIDDNVSIISLVPTQLVDIIADSITCPECLRVVVVGGGRLDPEVSKRAVQLGWPIKESYGMSETGSQIATGELAGSGFLEMIDGWQVRLNGAGTLDVKGDCLFKGYLVGSDGNFEFIDPKVDGWFSTSDRVELIEVDGKTGIKFLGRSDQQVKILGELVDVSALESRLQEILQHEIYLIPVADNRRGMNLYPVVDNRALIEKIRDIHWSGPHRLEEPVVVSDFPRNEMGKLQRVKLAEAVESIVFSAD